MPCCVNRSAGPTPESCSNCGELYAPLETRISRACAAHVAFLLGSDGLAGRPSNRMRCASADVSTCKLPRAFAGRSGPGVAAAPCRGLGICALGRAVQRDWSGCRFRLQQPQRLPTADRGAASQTRAVAHRCRSSGPRCWFSAFLKRAARRHSPSPHCRADASDRSPRAGPAHEQAMTEHFSARLEDPGGCSIPAPARSGTSS